MNISKHYTQHNSYRISIAPLFLIIIAVLVYIPTSLYAQYSPLPSNIEQHIWMAEQEAKAPAEQQKQSRFFFQGTQGTINGKAGIPIWYATFIQEKDELGAIMISSGRTEAALRYQELIYELFTKGYSVYIHDHRGQGLSGRMNDDKEMGHVDDFQYFIDDMKSFYDQIVSTGNHEKTFLLAHSMGGAIGFSYLEQHPEDFDAASFSSPMLAFGPGICPLSKILSGKTVKYAPGQTGYAKDSSHYATNSVTYSKIRYTRNVGTDDTYPESRIGGPSVQWLDESCKQLKKVHKNVAKIQTPFIIFTADNETVVNPKGSEKLINKATKLQKDCALYLVPNAKHEILMETDIPRQSLLNTTLDFFSKH